MLNKRNLVLWITSFARNISGINRLVSCVKVNFVAIFHLVDTAAIIFVEFVASEISDIGIYYAGNGNSMAANEKVRIAFLSIFKHPF